MNEQLLNILNSIVNNATPLVIASIGETLTERAGITNLSLNGSIMLSAMTGFATAYTVNNATGNEGLSLLVGIGAAMLVSALVAVLIAFASIELRQDQVAVGFVLTLLGADLAQFLGQGYTGQNGPQILPVPFPVVSQVPVVGSIFFNQSILAYFSYVLVFVAWWWLFRTRGGLAHRAVGERPEAAFARGTKVNRLRYLYTALGGALVGLAGAAYSLSVKAGWSIPAKMEGDGWIALAIVIFGGWHPFRVVLGAYLFAALRALASAVQSTPGVTIPVEVLNSVPWALMIITLLLVSSGAIDRLVRLLPRGAQRWTRNFLRSDPPAAIGTRFEGE